MSATLGCNNVLKTNRALRLFHTDLYTKKRKCNFGPVLYKENPDLKKIKKKITEQADGETARVRPLGRKYDSA